MFIAKFINEKRLKFVNIWQKLQAKNGCFVHFLRLFSSVVARRTQWSVVQ